MERHLFDEALAKLISLNGSDFVFKKAERVIYSGQLAIFKLGNLTGDIPVYVSSARELSGQWKYDLIFMWLEDDGWHTSRMYNIESRLLRNIPKETYDNEFWQAYKKEHGFEA
jgi:hypothetical protein